MKNQDFAQVMRMFDSSQTLHYLDPPYATKTTEQYGSNQVEPERVEKVARKMKGNVMVSYDNSAKVKRIFHPPKWEVHSIGTRGGLAGHGDVQRKDLLITNFNPATERAHNQPYDESKARKEQQQGLR